MDSTLTTPEIKPADLNGHVGNGYLRQSLHSAWHARAVDLATWAKTLLVNRVDVWGGYNDIEDRDKIITFADGHTGALGKTTTRPRVRDRGKIFLDRGKLELHFRATKSRHVVGLHTTSSDNMSRWGAIEIDKHDEKASAENNLRAALAWFALLRSLGFCPLLSESDGKGGYHLRIIFDKPVPTAIVFFFLQWLTRDFAEYGLQERPETFPKQARISGDGCGNWLRLIGRHHTSDHWARVWDGRIFLEGADAVEFVLGITGDSPSLIPTDAMPAQGLQSETSKTNEQENPSSTAGMSEEELAALFEPSFPDRQSDPPPEDSQERNGEIMLEALQHVPNGPTVPYEGTSKAPSWLGIGMATHSVDPTESGLKAWEEWSAHCREKHNKKCTCREKWASFGKFNGQKIGLGSLIMWAKANGWTGPANPPLTDVGNAQRFAREHGKDVRHCHPWNKWLVWDGTRWREDDAGRIKAIAKQTVLKLYREAQAKVKALESGGTDKEKDIADETLKWAHRSQDAKRINAMLDLARSEQ